MPHICVDNQTLTDWLTGTLALQTAETIAGHLETCETCQAAMDRLENDIPAPFSELNRPDDNDRFEDEHPLLEAIARIEKLGANSARKASGDAPVLPAERIRSYVLREPLGSGGMGEVFTAWHSDLDRMVAIKFLPRRGLRTPDSRERFRRERKALAQLDHPHVVRAIDAGEHEGQDYLVMELVDGVDVSRLVSKFGVLPIADACEIARQAALGLQYIHEQGLIHRDIKPGNLIVDRLGVKILDLGLVTFAEPDDDRELTSSGQLMGSIDYLAPEQGRDTRRVDIRADIFSLGATLFRLLTGTTLFKEKSFPLEKLTALAVDPIPTIAGLRADLPAGLIRTVSRMLQRDPEQRFSIPAEVAEALAPYCAGAGLEQLISTDNRNSLADTAAVADVPTQQLRQKPSTSSRRGVLAGLAVSMLVPLGAVYYFSRSNGKTVPVESAERVKVEIVPESDTEYAKALLNEGAELLIDQTGKAPITQSAQFPDGPFRITSVALMDKRDLTEQHFIQFSRLSKLHELQLSKSTFQNAWLSHLEKIKTLQILDINETAVGDEGLRSIGRSPNLQNLYLRGARFSNEGLMQLRSLQQLRILELTQTAVDDRGLVILKDAFPELYDLRLNMTQITETGLSHLAGQAKLKKLELIGTSIGDAGLEQLGKIHSLEHLRLQQADISDHGLKQLQSLPRLDTLFLNNTGISDSALKHLQAMTTLRLINLQGTKVTAAGVARLRKALPNCMVTWRE